MAHWVKFGIALAAGVAGLSAFLILPGWYGFIAFVVTFLAGSAFSHRVFERIATPEQIREDLETRLQGD